MKVIKLKVSEENDLISYLVKHSSLAKNKIKSLVKYQKITLNHKLVTKLPIMVKVNDEIVIDLTITEEVPFTIIYEDKDILVINKKAGLLTVSTDKEHDTLAHQVRMYANKHHFKAFIINRIDRETSGIVMFAKSDKVKKQYQDNWNTLAIKRGYIALVYGEMHKDGVIDNYLREENNTFVHSAPQGKRAITYYHILKKNKKYTLLDIDIKTGRKNQIRVHLSELGYPIVGDAKYGHDTTSKRMALHNYILIVKHPITLKEQVFEAPYQHDFDHLFKD